MSVCVWECVFNANDVACFILIRENRWNIQKMKTIFKFFFFLLSLVEKCQLKYAYII